MPANTCGALQMVEDNCETRRLFLVRQRDRWKSFIKRSLWLFRLERERVCLFSWKQTELVSRERNALMVERDNELITQDCDECKRVGVAPYDLSRDHRAVSLAVGASLSMKKFCKKVIPATSLLRYLSQRDLAIALMLSIRLAVNKDVFHPKIIGASSSCTGWMCL